MKEIFGKISIELQKYVPFLKIISASSNSVIALSKTSLDSLPRELVMKIFNYLNEKEIVKASLVSKTWLNLTSDKNLLHSFWHRSTRLWETSSLQRPSYMHRPQVTYRLKRIDPDLSQIVINFFKEYTTISFQDPKDEDKFIKILEDAGCVILPMPSGNIKTKEYSKALLALKSFLPPKLVEVINQDIERGSLLAMEYNRAIENLRVR